MSSNQTQPRTTNDEEDFQFAMQLASATVLPGVMRAAIELSLFEIIARAGPAAELSPKAIASHLPIQNPDAQGMLERLLRLLASYSILTSSVATHDDGSVERLYGLASVCRYLVPNKDGVSLSPMLTLFQDKVFMDSWYHLKDMILEGGVAFNKAHGMNCYQYTEVDPKFNQLFNTGMLNYGKIVMEKILETYRGFQELMGIVDVGGGLGTTVSLITSKYPKIKCINFDLPHVVKDAPPYPGVEHVGGNMFESVPNGEVIFMKWILHNWSDESCLKLLKNCYKAMPKRGKLIVVDAILPSAPETDDAAKGVFRLDVAVMIQIPEVKERTEEEFETMAKGAGFVSMKKVCCVYNYWVMEFYKM